MAISRFRADPSKVRVSIRRFNPLAELGTKNGLHDSPGWIARVESRANPDNLWTECVHAFAEEAVMIALRAADGTIDGVDLALDRTYLHPQW